MRLTDLRPQFLFVDENKDRDFFRHVDSIDRANGISFLCPLCYRANNGPTGTHRVICWCPGVSLEMRPAPGRWALRGSGYADLTLDATPNSSSVLLLGGCRAHFFVTGGEIVMA